MKKLRRYIGNIPKSGKTAINFAGIKISHLSKATDKSDMIVFTESGAVIASFPRKTDRANVLDKLAEHIDRLKHFIEHPESYELYEPIAEVKVKKEDVVDEVSFDISMEHYSDGSCVRGQC